MAGPSNGVTIADGSLDFSGGVNSVKVTTIASQQNPNGIQRNQLPWLINGSVRDGGITPRAGNDWLGQIQDGSALFQGGIIYDPPANFPTSNNKGNAQWLDGHGNPVVSRGTQLGSKPSGNPFSVPAVGLSFAMTLSAPYAGSLGDQVTLYATANGLPYGIYNVTNIAGNNITLESVYVTGIVGYSLQFFTILVFLPLSATNPPPSPPTLNNDPYLLVLIGGILYQVQLDPFVVVNLSAIFGLTMSATIETAYFCQAEEFVIIQIFDGITLPLFWDGLTLRRSKGITNPAVAPGTPGVNEIPAAGAMDYYMGRLWYARGRTTSAGDIVGGGSGTAAYGFRDSVLNVTENPLVLGGDGFTTPESGGNIRALKHNANLDTALGQGLLFIFTHSAVYSLKVPVTRTDWIAATNANQPLQTVVQLKNGSVNDRAIVAANGDLFYQSLEPGIRSLISAIRYFQQWGNIQISANENRVLQFCDRGLLHGMSGILFDNRLLMTSLPKQLPQGIVGQVIIPMDFVPLSSFGADLNPNWEGMREGLDILQLFTADFGGRERAFAVVVSKDFGTIDVWELTTGATTDTHPVVQGAARLIDEVAETRVTMVIEFPAFTWGEEFLLKKMVSAELWVDRVFGEVIFKLEWRPDGDSCWYRWHEWKICSARNCTEDVYQPCAYPILPNGTSYRQTMTLPVPPNVCATLTGRPANVFYQGQPRLTVKGFIRVRGLILHAEKVDRKLYSAMVC